MNTTDVEDVPRREKMWLETPLIRSPHLSSRLGSNVFLKLEMLQPSQSFKYRGMSLFAQDALRTHGADVHLVIASSGNAGIATACIANILGVRCTVFLPHGANQSTIDWLRREGAEVVVAGHYYLQALESAKKAAQSDPNAVVVPSYDHPKLWEGHASMIHEIQRQLPAGVKPDAICCSVGGGGLLGGVIEGCDAVGWDDVPIIAVETYGSNCFYQSLALNDGPFVGDAASRLLSVGTRAEHSAEHDVTVAFLSKLTSRASSLGASSPSPTIVKKALNRRGGVRSLCVPDELAMQSAVRFAEDHKTLVELACAAALAPASKPSIFSKVVPESKRGLKPANVVFILCGGFKVSIGDLDEYRRVLAEELEADGLWDIAYNGDTFTAPIAE